MAIRNTQLGGRDIIQGEACRSEDLNDTFDALYDIVKKANWD